jgi:hypothetical protein
MTILRTTLAALVFVAMAGLLYAGDGQKGPCQHGKSCGKDECPKGCGCKNCCCEEGCCTTKCDTVQYKGNCYSCECVTVCLPTRPCCPFRDPSCGCEKGKGACDPKGCCDRCDRCKGGKDGHEGKTCCDTKDGLLCKLAGGCCGKGKGGKGCCDPKGTCDPKDGKQKSDCGCGSGLLGGLLGGCCSCKPRVKKRLMVKSVVVCEEPILACDALDKGKCGGDKVDDMKVEGGVEDAPEAAPEVPEPPPVNVGQVRAKVAPASYTSTSLFSSLFK